MARYDKDKELNSYRNIVPIPETFEEGFNLKTIIGALFLGLIITPGSLYISLVAGQGVGPAARWVTIFLFAEVAKRSLKDLRQQEVFILYYMTSVVLVQATVINNTTFVLWNIFMVQSEAFQAMGISQLVPDWIVPKEALESGARTLFAKEWLPALALITFSMFLQRADHFGLGYFLYRITSDFERLPFPMASVGATGIMAMAETKDPNLQWRPRCFAIGGVIGLLFGIVYIGVPAVSGVILRSPIFIVPIPWIELTPTFKTILPATAVNIVPNLGMVILGMVLPFWVIVGGFCGLMFTYVMNPYLYSIGVLHTWRPGMKTVDTLFSNSIDFYLSFGLGVTFFIAALGLFQAFFPIIKERLFKGKEKKDDEEDFKTKWTRMVKGNPKRGDISIWLSLGIYVCTTTSYLVVSTWLVPGFPWYLFLIYGFIYTPIIAYASSQIEGLAGQAVAIPYVKEAAYILSGYKGVTIWFAPIPIYNYNPWVRQFRQVELTGTKLGSLIKTELIALPIVIFSMIFYCSIIWSQAPLNSDQYPYVQKVWDLKAKNQALIYSSTMEGRRSLFFEALNGKYLLTGFGLALCLYAFLSMFGLPVLLVFGFVRRLGMANPGAMIPEIFGALLGRFYFKRKFGDQWLKYTPAIYAGFSCGVGLIGMIGVAFRLIAKSIAPLDY